MILLQNWMTFLRKLMKYQAIIFPFLDSIPESQFREKIGAGEINSVEEAKILQQLSQLEAKLGAVGVSSGEQADIQRQIQQLQENQGDFANKSQLEQLNFITPEQLEAKLGAVGVSSSEQADIQRQIQQLQENQGDFASKSQLEQLESKSTENQRKVDSLVAEIDSLRQTIRTLTEQLDNPQSPDSSAKDTTKTTEISLKNLGLKENSQFEFISEDSIIWDTYTISKDKERGLIVARADGRKDYNQTLYFGAFTGTKRDKYEIVVTYLEITPPELFIGLCDTQIELDEQRFYDTYAIVAEFFKKGTFYASYGINPRKVDHANIRIDRGEYAKITFDAGGIKNRIVKLSSDVLNADDPFDAKYEDADSLVEWQVNLDYDNMPENLTGAIAIKTGSLNILASQISQSSLVHLQNLQSQNQ